MRARFVAACSTPSGFPAGELAEIAVAGRSNCGKSSLINAVVGQRRLARTSSTPGRTRQIVFFEVELPSAPAPAGPGRGSASQRFGLVDLPGYGYARVSRREAGAWAPLVEAYVDGRAQLRAMLLLLDIRRPPQDEERDLLRWCRLRRLEPLVVLTKADKLPKNRRLTAVAAAQRALQLQGRPLAVSVHEARTVEQLRRALVRLIEPPGVGAARRVVGLTGNIAAGKSRVAALLSELGAAIVDADRLAREVVAPGSQVLARIVEAFGAGVLNAAGALDRARLGRIVFGDQAARQQLEALTHPAIAEAARARFAELDAAGQRVVVYEAALLVETGRHAELDGPLVVVVADDETRLRRLIARDGLSPEQARQRLAAQLPQQRKAGLADYVIDNSGTIEQTRAQVLQLWQALAAAGGSA